MSSDESPPKLDIDTMTKEEFENEKKEVTLEEKKSEGHDIENQESSSDNLNNKKMHLDQLQNDIDIDNINIVDKIEEDTENMVNEDMANEDNVDVSSIDNNTPCASHSKPRFNTPNIILHKESKTDEDDKNSTPNLLSTRSVKDLRQSIQSICRKYNLDFDSTSNAIKNVHDYFSNKDVKFDEAFIFELINQGIQSVEEVTEMVTTINGINKQELLVDILMIVLDQLLREVDQKEEYARLVSLMKALVPTVASVIIDVSKNINKYQKTLQKKCKNMCC